MATPSDCIEWDEPRGAPENSDIQLGYSAALRLALSPSLILPILLFAALILFVAMTGKRHQVVMFVAALAALIALFMVGVLIILLGSRLLRRHVRLSSDGIRFSMFTMSRHFSFQHVKRVVIEPTGDGGHRLVIESASGERAKFRVPPGLDFNSLARLVPSDKLVVQTGPHVG